VTDAADLERHLHAAIELARRAREHGNHPFGALLADEEGNVVLEAENTVRTDRDVTAHAETNLMRQASARFEPDFLERCTLYTSTEPCAMCAGAIYWGNVRRVVFALSQEEIRRISGGNPANMQLEITCREVFARGDHDVEVSGPHLLDEARAVHDGFWG
jgi:tRNA(Arg) A34 adenosine deaminase TadA